MSTDNEMTCRTCGARLRPTQADLPFRREDGSIVVVRSLPVMKCPGCSTYFLQDRVINEIHRLLARVREGYGLQVIPFAA